MPSLASLGLPQPLFLFWGWCILTAVHFALGMTHCRLETGPLARAPDADPRFASEQAADKRFREAYRHRFGASEIIYVAFVNGAGGVLLWFAAQGKSWALVPLVPAALWLIYSNLSAPFTLRSIDPKLVSAWDWAYYFAGGAVWIYCAAYALGR